MEKLKPVLEQKYWIFFVVALLLPTWAWWSHTGELAAETASRTSTVTSLKGKVPTPANHPGPDWIAKGKEVNKEQADRMAEAAMTLYGRQQDVKTWPDQFADYAGGNLTVFDKAVRRKSYKEVYPSQIDSLYRIVDPFNVETSQGKVVLDKATLPQVTDFGIAPNKDVILEAQDDIWLTRSLLEAIARVNGDATSLADSTIRKINYMQLFGASPKAAAEEEEDTGGGLSRDEDEEKPKKKDRGRGEDDVAEKVAPGTLMHDKNARGGAGKQIQRKTPKVDVDLEEEFGQVSGTRGGTTSTMADAPEEREGMGLFSAQRRPSRPTGGAGGPAVEAFKTSRFVNPDDKLPYRERGFELEVAMDHRELPELLAELSAMPWPVKFHRVHWAEMNLDKAGPGALTLGRMPNSSRRGDEDAPMPVQPIPGQNSNDPKEKGRKFQEQALADQNLARVIVVGTMTMYKEPAIDKKAAAKGAAAPGAAATPAPAADVAEPAAEAPSEEEAAPAGDEAAPAAEAPTSPEADETPEATPAEEGAAPPAAETDGEGPSGESPPAAEPPAGEASPPAAEPPSADSPAEESPPASTGTPSTGEAAPAETEEER